VIFILGKDLQAIYQFSLHTNYFAIFYSKKFTVRAFLYYQNNLRIGKKQRKGVPDSRRFAQVEKAGQEISRSKNP